MITISSRTTTNFLPRNSGLIWTISRGRSYARTERGTGAPTDTETFTLVTGCTFCLEITSVIFVCCSCVTDSELLVEPWVSRRDPA